MFSSRSWPRPRTAHVCDQTRPENGQFLPVDTAARIRQSRAMPGETQNQFSFTHVALSKGRRLKSNFLSISINFGVGQREVGGALADLDRRGAENGGQNGHCDHLQAPDLVGRFLTDAPGAGNRSTVGALGALGVCPT